MDPGGYPKLSLITLSSSKCIFSTFSNFIRNNFSFQQSSRFSKSQNWISLAQMPTSEAITRAGAGMQCYDWSDLRHMHTPEVSSSQNTWADTWRYVVPTPRASGMRLPEGRKMDDGQAIMKYVRLRWNSNLQLLFRAIHKCSRHLPSTPELFSRTFSDDGNALSIMVATGHMWLLGL